MNDNFVSIVGYQLEKVHTGVIRWLMDTLNTNVSMDTKYEIIRRTYSMIHPNNSLDFGKDEIIAITCFPEYAIGRKRKIDLVIRIDLAKRPSNYFVIEMKVDSIPYKDQLSGTKTDFLQLMPDYDPKNVTFFLYLLGTSSVCQVPDELHSFHIVSLPNIIGIYRGLPVHHYIYNDWMSELEAEAAKRDAFIKDYEQSIGIHDRDRSSYWQNKGYRGRQHHYYLYDEMKKHAKNSQHWAIDNGGNNPVMNYWGMKQNGWEPKSYDGHAILFYWEFNHEDFFLKACLHGDDTNKISQESFTTLRAQIIDELEKAAIENGARTRPTYGTFVSIFKWKLFKGSPANLPHIMEKADKIIALTRPIIKRIQ
ncbi:PD-(D/E)XK nuclease family protein [Paenibacillus sp. MMS18-CY102]|uniref:PD-(D/E)XK nuclease family protein n=1 Tax=Paenibacillus sp. MMS18-CY102 TaxID=2682849 RepID=UPI001365F8B5|nr:PD-(D/E)XK nuclease family protein [Paenibacillus sp. MMS18-CY102]MWC27651.1 hypothetical protein [Paenibacillus sp. MMS18-CY102]